MSDTKIGNSPQPSFERPELDDVARRPGPVPGPGSPVEDIARPPIEEAMRGLSDHLLNRENSASSLKDVPFNLPTERGLPQQASDWLLQHNKLVVTEGGPPGSPTTLKQALDKSEGPPQPGPIDRPTGVPGPPTPDGFKGITVQVPVSGTFDSSGIHIANPIDLIKSAFQGSPPPGAPASTSGPGSQGPGDPTQDSTGAGSPPGDYPDPSSGSGSGAAAALGGDSVDGGDTPIERLV
jgi:hypothetical protein